MFDNLTYDLKRHFKTRRDYLNIYLWSDLGLWATLGYRFHVWTRSIKIPLVSFIFRLAGFIVYKLTEIICGVSIPASVQIKRGLYIGHFGGIIINSRVQIGENCSIGPGVIIGTRGLGNQGVPVLKNNVFVGSGAKILGNVHIGNNVHVGANAVVLNDVPAGNTVVGIPARIIKDNTRAFPVCSTLLVGSFEETMTCLTAIGL